MSFTVDGNHLSWQRWDLRVALDPVEGLVLHDVGYQDGDRRRPVLHRASLSEMVVPYGATDAAHRWKNAFDAGEWGLGRFVNSLKLGCDCLGEITYLDAVMADEQGNPWIVEQAVCIHEEDDGIAWKHQDLNTGNVEVRRSRRLVVSAIFTVGNYEYAFYWRFHLDGSIELEVRLTGIVQPCAFDEEPPANMSVVAPHLAAAHHQHLFCLRLDLDVDGGPNSVYEVDVLPGGGEWDNGIEARATLLATEQAAQRDVDPSRSRTWKVVNPSSTNGVDQPVGYKLLPAASPTLLAGEGSVVRRRAAFATHNLWVTPYAEDETAGRRPLAQPARRRRRPPRLDRSRPFDRGHRRRALAHLRADPRRPPRGLARHARRAHRLLADPGGLLRPQPGPGPPPVRSLRLADLVGVDRAHGQVDGQPDRAGPGLEDEWAQSGGEDARPQQAGVGRVGIGRGEAPDQDAEQDEQGQDRVHGDGADPVALDALEVEVAPGAVVAHQQPPAEHVTGAAQRAVTSQRPAEKGAGGHGLEGVLGVDHGCGR